LQMEKLVPDDDGNAEIEIEKGNLAHIRTFRTDLTDVSAEGDAHTAHSRLRRERVIWK
jgi:hypothetical protein